MQTALALVGLVMSICQLQNLKSLASGWFAELIYEYVSDVTVWKILKYVQNHCQGLSDISPYPKSMSSLAGVWLLSHVILSSHGLFGS